MGLKIFLFIIWQDKPNKSKPNKSQSKQIQTKQKHLTIFCYILKNLIDAKLKKKW